MTRADPAPRDRPAGGRIVIPPTGNEFITLLKLTSLGVVISVHELLTAATVRRVELPVRGGVRRGARLLPRDRERADVLQSQLERRFTWKSAGRRRRTAPVAAVAHDAR
jgi:hypothetical protein